MRAIITPSALNGSACAPASKSFAHRALICAALSERPTEIICSTVSDDIDATAGCLEALGAAIEQTASGFIVSPIEKAMENAALNCCESGSTLRFMLPVAAAMGKGAKLYGKGRLPQRPLGELVSALSAHGIRFSSPALPLEINGKMSGGAFETNGATSSQFISGLLFALPLTNVDSSITVGAQVQSRPYIEMTVSVLKSFGISSFWEGESIAVPAPQQYVSPGVFNVEGDWSNAAFFICAAALSGGCVKLNGLTANSLQGDKKVVEIIREYGAQAQFINWVLTIDGAQKKPLVIDVGNIPDLVPVLAVTSCFAKGKSVFFNAARLKLKESDRLASTVALINSLGGRAETNGDSLTVYGCGGLRGGEVDSFGDHRIAMAAAVAASACEKETVINGSEAVKKSFPAFFNEYAALGGKVREE